jgi:hypothetical protein
MYLPDAAILNGYVGTNGRADATKMLDFTKANGLRLIKVAAILSPPLVNKLVEVFASAPKGT